MYEVLEVAAALRHVVVHVEARAGRREQHDGRLLGQRMRNLDRLAHRVARCVDLVLGEAIVNSRPVEAGRRTADEDQRIDALADELH